MIKRLSALLACTVLAACATPPAELDDSGRQWIYSADADEPRLMYGTPQSDDVVVAMSCTPRSGWVTLSFPGMDPAYEGVRLASGDRDAIYRGTTEPDQLNGGVILTARARADSPPLAEFARTGRLQWREPEGRVIPLHASPATRGYVAQFFAACA